MAAQITFRPPLYQVMEQHETNLARLQAGVQNAMLLAGARAKLGNAFWRYSSSGARAGLTGGRNLIFRHNMRPRACAAILFWAVILGFAWRLHALTLDEIRRDPRLTPARLMRYFSKFKYEFHEQVQEPDAFLFTEAGDCDDFATLADALLREKGYHTRLISVRMPGLIHVVCYVEESRCYLDYNQRAYFKKTVSCPSDLRAVAQKVARSFDAAWTSASEFTYADHVKTLRKTISQTDIYRTDRRSP